MDSSAVFTEILKKKKGELNPVLVEFQNGNLTDRSITKSKVKLTPTSKGDGTTVKIITPNGHEFVSEKRDNLSDKTMLAIRNKKTNKIRLVEVDYALLMNSVLMKKKETVVTPEAPKDANIKATMTLNKLFGNKKAQRRLDQQEKLNIDTSFAEIELKETVKDMDVSQTANQSMEDDGLGVILPPCNRSATLVSDVYSLVKMVGDEELDALKSEVDKVINNKEYTSSCTEFFQYCLGQVMKSNSNLELQVAGLLYVELLLSFLKEPVKNLKSYSICSFSEVVKNRIINDFCIKTDNSLTRPVSLRDKTICYVIAIATICTNYMIDLLVLSRSSSFNVKKLGQLSRYLGLSPLGKESVTYVLKLPLLPFPRAPKPKARKR